jgi:tyrosine-protein phosphatase SIW14
MAWTEGVHLDEEMVVPYRPRSRRNSLQDELCRAQPPLDTADVHRKTNSTSTSQREFRELSSSLDSSVEALMYGKELLDGKTVRTEKCKQLREPLVPELADSPQVQLTIQPTPPSEKIIPTEGRPFNFGIVVPGVYRSSYPKPEDFGFINNLELKTIVLVPQINPLCCIFLLFSTFTACFIVFFHSFSSLVS